MNKLFEWDAQTDTFNVLGESSLLAEIADDRGVDPHKLQNEIVRRGKVLSWMKDNDVTHYTEVGRISSNYYRHPRRLLEQIGEV